MSYDAPGSFVGTVGITGKIPAKADFISRGLPGKFLTDWSNWIDAVMRQGSATFGEDWTRSYLVSPPFRFLLGPGCIGPWSWAGVLLPSSDGFKRVYPLSLVLGFSPSSTLPCDEAIFTAIETIAIELADGTISLDAAIDSVNRHMRDAEAAPVPAFRPLYRWPEDGIRDIRLGYTEAGMEAPTRSPEVAIARLWHTDWDGRPPLAIESRGLPTPKAFTSLIDRNIIQHGWEPVPEA